MSYWILRMTIGDGPERIAISRDEFTAIKRARDLISGALTAEQMFDIVVENFFEFEHELLELSLRHSFAMVRPWQSFAHDRLRANRRLGNLTFATKLFTDQLDHDAKSLLGRRSEARKRLHAALHEEFQSLPHRTLTSQSRDAKGRGCACNTAEICR